MSAVDELAVRRLMLAVGLAVARQDEQALMELLSDVDPDTAGALMVGLATSWVGAVETACRFQGSLSPLSDTISLLKAETLEVAAK